MRSAAIVLTMLFIPAWAIFAQEKNTGAVKAGDVRKNSIGMEFVWIPPGEFMMGSDRLQTYETPVHLVKIARGFWLGKYEVTQGQWQAVMGSTLRQHKDAVNDFWDINGEGPDYPMYYVSWEQAKEFVRRLNQTRDPFEYSLPSEAQWEYAARAGTTGDYYGNLDSIAWHAHNSNNLTHPVGQKQPNAFGLYDMSGNVWEWVEDIFKRDYQGLPADGSANLKVGDKTLHVIRGGSFYIEGRWSRSANRDYSPAVEMDGYLGFRVAARVK